jgi:hypothetical protein
MPYRSSTLETISSQYKNTDPKSDSGIVKVQCVECEEVASLLFHGLCNFNTQ